MVWGQWDGWRSGSGPSAQVGRGRAFRAIPVHIVLDLVNGRERYAGLRINFYCGSIDRGSSVHFRFIIIIYSGLRGQILRYPGWDGSQDLPRLSVQRRSVCNG